MFRKHDIKIVKEVGKSFFCLYYIAKYQKYEDLEKERLKRSALYDKLIKNDGCINDFFLRKVYKNGPDALSQSNTYFFIRIVKKRKVILYDKIKLLKEEFEVRQDIRHMFLVNFICSFQDLKHLYYITEFASGGFLFYYLRSRVYFSKKEAMFYIAEIITAIQYLHSKDLLYRSLFPDNIMLSKDGHIKLQLDFLNKQGLDINEFENNIQYISFDYINGHSLDRSSDYWQIGVVLYELLVGFNPFIGSNFAETQYNILYRTVTFPISLDVCAIDLIKMLLKRNKKERLGNLPSDAMLIKKHMFFKSIDWDALERCEIQPPMKIQVANYDFLATFNLDEIFDSNYHHDQTDGYGNIFEFYGGSQLKKYRPW